jgi:hypothetical protein
MSQSPPALKFKSKLEDAAEATGPAAIESMAPEPVHPTGGATLGAGCGLRDPLPEEIDQFYRAVLGVTRLLVPREQWSGDFRGARKSEILAFLRDRHPDADPGHMERRTDEALRSLLLGHVGQGSCRWAVDDEFYRPRSSDEAPPLPGPDTTTGDPVTEAIGILGRALREEIEMPSSLRKLAKMVRCSHTTISRNKTIQTLWQARVDPAPPRGWKQEDGRIEASGSF